MNIVKIPGEIPGVHYEVDFEKEPLGVGGMGTVMAGERVDNNTGVRIKVAVKFLFDDLNADTIERARREASVCIDNENLVKMYAFLDVPINGNDGKTVHRYHVVSELLNGVMLADVLTDKYEMPQHEISDKTSKLLNQYSSDRKGFALNVTKAVLSGIMALHDKGYVHRDIDPSNIMITWDGKIKVIDFGISKNIENPDEAKKLTVSGQFMGKAAYAAPELAAGDTAYQNEMTDIYAIGIMLYELVTGSVPFSGPTHEVLKKQLEEQIPYSNINDKRLRTIIQNATAKSQDNRYPSAASMRVDIEKLQNELKGSKTTSHHGTISGIKAAKKSNNKVIVIAAAVVGVILLAGAIVWISIGSSKQDDIQKTEELVETPVEIQPLYFDGMPAKDHIALINDEDSYKREREYVENMLSPNSDAPAKEKSEAAFWFGSFVGGLDNVPENAKKLSPLDLGEMHQWFVRAADINPDNFDALYELCSDVQNERGTNRDEAKLLEYITKAQAAAAKYPNDADIKQKSEKLQMIADALN